MKQVVTKPRAARDLLEHYLYIGQSSPRAAERFLDAAEATFARLAEQPGMGRRWDSSNPDLAGVRVWPISGFRKYLVFYRSIADGIEVLYVFHSARDIRGILEG